MKLRRTLMATAVAGTRRRRRVIGRLGIGAAAAFVTLAAVTLAAAAGSAPFADAAGDSGTVADVTSVRVSNDDARRVTFTVTLANRPDPKPGLVLAVLVDSDRNAATGNTELRDGVGAEFLLMAGSMGGRGFLFGWNGSDWAPAAASPVASFTAPAVPPGSPLPAGTLKITIPPGGLGKTSGFHFVIRATEEDVEGRDLAPDRGMWSYTLVTAPLRLWATPVAFQPARPVSGGAFSAWAAVRRSDGTAVTRGSVTCRVTLGGRALAGVHGRLGGGFASCSGRLPRGAAGKTVRGTITVKSASLSVTRTFSARVAR